MVCSWLTAQIRLFTELHQHEPANVVSNILTDMSASSRWPEIGREEVIFSRRPQKTIFPPLYGLFENGIFARGGGLGVRPVMFRGDVQRTGVEMLADLSPAPAAKIRNSGGEFAGRAIKRERGCGARAGRNRLSRLAQISHEYPSQNSFHITDLPHVVTLSSTRCRWRVERFRDFESHAASPNRSAGLRRGPGPFPARKPKTPSIPLGRGVGSAAAGWVCGIRPNGGGSGSNRR